MGHIPVEVLPEQLGARLVDAPAQAQDWHLWQVVLPLLMVVLLTMAQCMQMEEDAGALWPVVPSGGGLAAPQQ